MFRGVYVSGNITPLLPRNFFLLFMLSFWRAISIYGSAEEYFPKWSHHYFCREELYIYEKNELIPGLGFLLFRKKHIMHIECWKKKKHN